MECKLYPIEICFSNVFPFLLPLHGTSRHTHSTLQRGCEWQRAARQVLQSLLAVPGWLPAAAALPRHAGVRSAQSALCRATDRGL